MAPRLLWEPSHGRDAPQHSIREPMGRLRIARLIPVLSAWCASGRTDTKRVGVLSESSSDTPSNPVGPCAFWWDAPPGPRPVDRSTGGDPSGTVRSRTFLWKRPNTRGAERPPPVHTRGRMGRSIRVSRPRAWLTLESFHAVGFIARGWTPPGTRGGSAALRGALGSSSGRRFPREPVGRTFSDGVREWNAPCAVGPPAR